MCMMMIARMVCCACYLKIQGAFQYQARTGKKYIRMLDLRSCACHTYNYTYNFIPFPINQICFSVYRNTHFHIWKFSSPVGLRQVSGQAGVYFHQVDNSPRRCKSRTCTEYFVPVLSVSAMVLSGTLCPVIFWMGTYVAYC